jgi:ribosomal protein L24E
MAKTLLRVEADGTRVFMKNNKLIRVAPTEVGRSGFYSPFASRADMYRGRRDPRTTEWFAEAVRERRQRTGTMFRAVKPGRQHL